MADLIDRQKAIDAIAEFLFYTSNFDGMRQGFDLSDWKWKIEGVLSDLPSSQPTQTNTPNTLDALDCVSRQAAIDVLEERLKANGYSNVALVSELNRSIRYLMQLPSAQPEYRMDEWCTDCKEYDHERHCCPRFNHVIRTTLQEVQAEQPELIRCKDCLMHGVCRFEHGLGLDGYCSQAERRAE